MSDVYEKAARALGEMHSHEIVLEEAIVVLCDEVGLTHVADGEGKMYVLSCPEVTDRKAHVATASYRQMAREVAAGKPGGHLANAGDGARYVAASEICEAVTYLLTGTNPSSQFFGRGSGYRANVAAIRSKSEQPA